MSVKQPNTFHLDPDFELASLHQLPQMTFDSPAHSIMQDFRLHPAITVSPQTPASEAQWLLAQSHTPELLVVDRQGHLCGLASESSLSEQAIIQQIGKGFAREDIQVRDLMIQRKDIAAMDYDAFSAATVGDIITLLSSESLKTLLVVDKESREILGILSSKLLAKLFNLPETSRPPATFMEIFEAVMH